MKKKYDIIIGNGCSFTQGGGLNNPLIYKFLTGKEEEGNAGEIYMKENSYPKFLSELLDCEYMNTSESCSSNNFILERAYKLLKELKEKGNLLIINQLSYASRFGFATGDKYYSYNNLDGKLVYDYKNNEHKNGKFTKIDSSSPFDQYYKKYILEVFDAEYYWECISMQMDLFNSWCEKRNIDNYWVSWDEYNRISHIDRVIDCEGEHAAAWATNNELLLSHIPNIPQHDLHLSIEGHKNLTNIIFDRIKLDNK